MEAKNFIGLIVIGFVVFIVGIIFLNSIANTIAAQNVLSSINESITITGGSGKTANNPVTAVGFFGNSSNNSIKIANTLATTVNFTRNGDIRTAVNVNQTPENWTVWANGAYSINYTFQPALFIDNPTAQTINSLNILWVAVTIILVGVFIVMQGFKQIIG